MYTVLLVDDEKYILTSLKASTDWQKHSFEICGEAYNADSAIDMIDRLCPNLVITDIRMPGMDGLSMIALVHQKHPDILFVAISGYADFQYVKKAMSLEVITYWLKPFDIEEIDSTLTKCKKILDERQSERQIEVVGELYGSHIISPKNVKNPVIKSVLALVNESFTVNYTISELAQRFLVNENYLSQLFKKEIGEPFTVYVTKLRLMYACTLLKTTELSINEISNRVGYTDYFYFARLFKREFSMSPSEYKANTKTL